MRRRNSAFKKQSDVHCDQVGVKSSVFLVNETGRHLFAECVGNGVPEITAYLVTAGMDRRTDGASDITDIGTQRGHTADGILLDSRNRSAPSGVTGTDYSVGHRLSASLIADRCPEKYGYAVGSTYRKGYSRTVGNKTVTFKGLAAIGFGDIFHDGGMDLLRINKSALRRFRCLTDTAVIFAHRIGIVVKIPTEIHRSKMRRSAYSAFSC